MNSISKHIILSTFIGLTFLRCQTDTANNNHSIEVFNPSFDATEVALSKIASTPEIIRLGSVGDDFVTRVMDIAHNKDLIFVLDIRAIFQFDRQGNYLGRIGSVGDGPGEYRSLMSMAVNSKTDQIFVSTYNKIIVYNLEGDFLREEKVSSWIDGISMVEDNLHAFITERGFPSENLNKSITKTFLLSLDNDLQVMDSLLVKSVEVDKGTATALGYGMSFISNNKDNDYLYFPVVSPDPIVRDTIYRLNDGKIIPELKLDFGIRDRLEEKFGITSMVKSQNYVLTNFFRNSKSKVNLLSLSSEGSVTVEGGFEDDFFNTGKATLKPWNLENDEFYFIKDAYELEGIIDGVNEDDNPVLFVLKVSN